MKRFNEQDSVKECYKKIDAILKEYNCTIEKDETEYRQIILRDADHGTTLFVREWENAPWPRDRSFRERWN
jgi:hypothetical protein